MRRWQKISFEICCRLPTDRFSIWNTIDKLELRNSVRNKFKEVFTILYTMEYLAESRKANEAKALNSRKGIERSDEICRNRSEIGLNVAPSRFHCASTIPKFLRRFDVEFHLRKFGASIRRVDDDRTRWTEKLFSFLKSSSLKRSFYPFP